MTAKLTLIFQTVVDLLKFAEAKNAILLAFCGSGLTAVVTYLSTATNVTNSLRLSILVSAFLLYISSLICLLSFFPKTDLERIISWVHTISKTDKKKLSSEDNFYYFGHLQKYNAEELLDAISTLYFDNQINQQYRKEDLDIANQIIINSKITLRKFNLFSLSLKILIGSILAIPIVYLSLLILSMVTK